MRARLALPMAAAFLLAPLGAGSAQAFEELPPYVLTQHVTGTIHSWGHGFLKVMMKDWEEGFRQFQPDVKFDDTLVSSAAAMAGLYSGRAELGVLAREITPPEVAAYEKMTGQPLFGVDVLTGSYGNPDKIMALGIFVNTANPIDRLTFAQLDAIFGAERRRGEAALIRTWGEAGLQGTWAKKRIQPYSGPAFEAPGAFFSHAVLGGSVLWNCDLRQLEDLPVAGGKDLDGYQRIVDAVGADTNAIAISGAGYRNPHAKLIALAETEGGPYVAATRDNVANRSYPLARPVRFYIHGGPRVLPDPAVVEFLRYVLSRDGQRQVLREGEFFPVPAAVAERERSRLDAIPHKP